MHMLINIEDLETRFARLRLQSGDIADLAGIHRTTWLRAVRGEVDLRGRNFRKLYEAVCAEELRLLEHLIALHPEYASGLLSRRSGHEGSGGALRVRTPDGAAGAEAATPPTEKSGPDFSASPQGGGESEREDAA